MGENIKLSLLQYSLNTISIINFTSYENANFINPRNIILNKNNNLECNTGNNGEIILITKYKCIINCK